MFDSKEDRSTTINEFMILNKIGVAYSGRSKDDIVQEHLNNRKYIDEHNMMEQFVSDK